MFKIVDKDNNTSFTLETMHFSAGESFFKIKNDLHLTANVFIYWQYENDEEFFILIALCNYLQNENIKIKYLIIPYLPHSRQDRFSGTGQPFSLSICLDLLWLAVSDLPIYTLDIHSDVYKKLNIDIHNISSIAFAKLVDQDYDFIISPDKGAIDRAKDWALELDILLVCASKVRDPDTGKLKNPKLPRVDLTNKKCLIVDDIIDGAYTFIQLTKLLKEKDARQVDLFATHSIFSKGIDCILEQVDFIYTTDSLHFYKQYEQNSKLKIFKINDDLTQER